METDTFVPALSILLSRRVGSLLQAGSPHTRVRLFLRGAERFFFVVGLLALLWVAVVYVEMPLYQLWANSRLNQMQKGRKEKLRTPSSGSLIGRIEISRIGLSTILLEGADSRTLRLAAGHIPGTAFPGGAGNIGIAGHRDTFFRKLQRIRDNDIITLTTPQGSFRYQVDSVQIVEPGDVDVLDGFPSETRLTLVTCYPFRWVGSAPHRFVVSAREVSPR
jgi:sortase A